MKMQPVPFESPSQSLFVREPNGMVMHVSIGGPRLLMPIGEHGKTVRFELHNYFGPCPRNKTTDAELTRVPKGFYEAFERWEAGGKLVDGDLCVLPAICPHCGGLGFDGRSGNER
jgi:hypothetical protein